MNERLKHYYLKNRQHQLDTYGNSGLWFQGRDQRQFTGGGAAYGWHAVAAWNSARSHCHFVDRLGADLKAHRKRSAAAKRGWKKRKGQ
jgi:hypothetical protein